MCSRYAGQPPTSYAAVGGVPQAYGAMFSHGLLPRQTESGLAGAAAAQLSQLVKFVDYIGDGELHYSNRQGKCGSCWAFVIASAVQCSAQLTYRRRFNRFFVPRYMSAQFMLSCYQVPDVMCGCMGGDLAKAMQVVARLGTVLERNFQYDNNEQPTEVNAADAVCVQNERGFEGTCPPCDWGHAPKHVGAHAVDCVPCREASLPRFFPSRPFHVGDPTDDLDSRVSAIKTELRRAGPLGCVIDVNEDAFRALGQVGLIERAEQAPVYAPESVPAAPVQHAVLIVGYYDPWAQTRRPADRASAVWICRNSWGADWGYSLRTVQLRAVDGSVTMEPTDRGGFFNVAMYDRADVTNLVYTVVSFEEVLTQAPGDAGPRQLRASDALTLERPSLAPPRVPSLGSQIGQPVGGSSAFPWAIAALTASLVVLAALVLLLFWGDGPSTTMTAAMSSRTA